MALESDVAALIDQARTRPGIPPEARAADMRAAWQIDSRWMRGETDPALALIPARDDVVAGVPVRWYGDPAEDTRDIVVYLHGGGWMLGDIEAYDDDVRLLARRLGRTILAVEYRRTPEVSFPAPLEDCLGVLRALADRPHRRLAVAGDSAGGNLALACAVALASERIIDAILALYPVIDPNATDNGSYRENGSGYLLTTQAMRMYWRSYLPSGSPRERLRADLSRASVEELPATIIATAGHDPLRDEAREFAARLVLGGVETLYLPNPGLTHGFQQMVPRIHSARAALFRAYDAFRLLLDRPYETARADAVSGAVEVRHHAR